MRSFLFLLLLCSQIALAEPVVVPILVYHRFGPVVADTMTVRTSVFATQLDFLHRHGYTIIPLRRLITYLTGDPTPLPPRAIVITVDDGHATVYTDLFPMILRDKILVTLFVYPSAVSNASYALTWDQLIEMKKSGLVDIQSHTYWHPNFKIEKRKLDADAYVKFVLMQMSRSKALLEQRLGGAVDMLAWPFGIYDDELIALARQSGYIAAFTIERHSVNRADALLSLPRYLMTDQVRLDRLLAP